ncbi:chromatin modification-related protein EAF1 B-like isoform X2 [Macadamia integrifolia]|uniref:chromatin modification-related protein EAF1 B-like isoform X2 n=1 Tax=Macadamia integrifolia TaxID=60698 RepID=UPI001C4E8F96|nr:chromatin modification-related protein EAF1 B-like isoform X2 [Macadamia integrifolia]
MHGHSPGSALLVNAEVDSMGGVIDGGVGIDSKFSPHRAAIEKAQAELRQEYDVREERRRELEFLEKGGNPLDFKSRPATSLSVQSTSLTDQPAEQFVTSEAKGSCALAASPHGDSVDSSGKPGVPPSREPNSGDNLLLFDGENYPLEGKRNSKHTGRRNNIAPSEQSSQLDGNHNAKESEDSVMFRLVKSQAYARRNRSRSSRDSAWACSTDIVPPADGNGSSSLPSAPHGSRDAKGSITEAKDQKDHTVRSIANSKSTGPNGSLVSKTVASDNQADMELDAGQAIKTATDLAEVSLPAGPEVTASRDLHDGNGNQQLPMDDGKIPESAACVSPDLGEKGVSAGLACKSSTAIAKTENHPSVGELNGFGTPIRDEKDLQNQDQNGAIGLSTKGLDSESSSTQITHSLDGNTSSDPCLNKVHANGNSKEQKLIFGESLATANADLVKQNSETKAVDAFGASNCVHDFVEKNLSNNVSDVKFEEEIYDSRTGLQNEGRPLTNIEGMEPSDNVGSKTENKLDNSLGDNSNLKKAGFSPQGGPSSTPVSSNCELLDPNFCGRGLLSASEPQTCTGNQLKVLSKEHEDFILKEAHTIEAKRKRIAELSVGNLPSGYRCKSHWDFVLEEMAWLANDFMQERLWKIAAAAQMCRMAAFTGRLMFNEQNLCQKQRKLAHIVAKSVMQFWHSAKTFLSSNDPTVVLKEWKEALVGSKKVNAGKAIEDCVGEHNMETSKHTEEQNPGQSPRLAIQGYAVRFLKCNSFHDLAFQAEAPVTTDRISDLGILEREERSSRESLFYTVLPGAMEEYRKSIESHWAQHEKTCNNMQQEEVETSMYDALSEFGSRENAYEEDEGGTGTYYSPGNFQGRKPSKFVQKKQKTLLKSYPPRSYEVRADPYGHCMENKLATQPSSLMGKRPNSLAVGSIPTKRMRTASRQRVLCPFSAAATGSVQITNKTDVSSGDTSSFQDDQSTLHGGSQFRKEMEVESTGEFGKQLPSDYTDILTKPKKKKKAKHLFYKNSLHSTEAGVLSGKGVAFEQRCQLDSMVQSEQRDHSKKRMEGHHFESNGNNGLFGQHVAKRPKIMKQLADTSPENFAPVTGSIPSPVASQMSNMSNPNKLMKMIAGRDRGRKAKVLKVPAGQSGSGSPWSLFEDQALVVLVHDMGPNWELVSDAINSTLQFKCIFRKPKECKERHKILMDRNGGDGADSAEDSGSSQPYPSTLPGIPKGSARQLFQRLQGPMEEDTLKSHFEKIILLGQQMHSRRSQNDNQELKQIAPVHNSHIIALSQVCPNNLNGGTLTPLDLCDATTSGQDVHSLGYQGCHNSGLAITNQGSVASVLPTSGANTMLQGSSGMTLGNSLPSPSSGLSAPTRYGAPRPASLPVDEQQRIHQMLSGRNVQQPGMSVPGAMPGTDRGVRMLPGGNGMGIMCGMNRGMPMPRPGFQGIGSAAMLNSGSMLTSSGVGMPSPVNMHTGAVSAQGSSMLGPCDALHLMRPGQNPEDQRQMMMQELQMQVTQGSSQGVPPYNGLSTAFSNQTIPPSVQTFPVQHQQHQMPPQQPHVLHHPRLQGNSHATNPQQQAYILRLAKERQLQQRYLHQQQQQHQFSASNPLMPHPQSQSQHPISSSMQNSSQIQKQVSSQPVSMPPPNSEHPLTPSSPMNPISSQSQQKHHLQPHGHGRNTQAGGVSLPNQMMKQRQRQQQQQQQQQLQQPGRHPPQQRQQAQSQQQAKLMKGLGRGNMMIHQNLAIDPSHVNGFPTTTGNQVAEKGEKVMHLMQGQGLYPGVGSNSIQPGKQLIPQSSNQCQPQQKMFPRPPPPSSKQLSQMPSHPDNCNQGQVPSVSPGHILPSQQPVSSLSMASSHQQQHSQPQQRQGGQPPHAIQRMLQQSRQMSSDPPLQSPVEHIQVTQHTGNNAFQMATTTAMPQSSTELSNVVPVVSSASTPQWKAPEPLYDAGSPNAATNLAAVGNSPLPNTIGTESISSPRRSQRQFSGNMSIHGHNVGTQWQQPPQQQSQPSPPPLTPPAPALAPPQQTQPMQQQPPAHPAPSPPPPPQPPAQPPQSNPPSQQHQLEPPQRQQLPQLQQSQQQNLPAGEGGLHARHTDSGSG